MPGRDHCRCIPIVRAGAHSLRQHSELFRVGTVARSRGCGSGYDAEYLAGQLDRSRAMTSILLAETSERPAAALDRMDEHHQEPTPAPRPGRCASTPPKLQPRYAATTQTRWGHRVGTRRRQIRRQRVQHRPTRPEGPAQPGSATSADGGSLPRPGKDTKATAAATRDRSNPATVHVLRLITRASLSFDPSRSDHSRWPAHHVLTDSPVTVQPLPPGAGLPPMLCPSPAVRQSEGAGQ